MERIVKRLIEREETISTMESCTGGALANAITNIPDASKVIKFSAVTYSNEFKEKMGVSKELIDRYSVYSSEVACDMAKKISLFTNSTYGVGITGKLKKFDEANPYGEDDLVYLAIYDKGNDICYNEKIKLISNSRIDCKNEIIACFVTKMLELL